MPASARQYVSLTDRRECAADALAFKADALRWCSAKGSETGDRGRPAPVRDLTVQAAAALGRAGTDGLRYALLTSVVPGEVEHVQVRGRTRLVRAPRERQRRMKRERFQAAGRVLLLLLAHMDIVTGDVCRDEHREHIGMLVSTIAEKLALEQRRVERILWVFDREGILESWQKSAKDKATGDVYGLAAVRKINLDALAPRIRPGLQTEWEKIRAETARTRKENQRGQLTPDQRAAQAGAEAAARNRMRRIVADSPRAVRPAAAAGLRQVECFTTGAGLAGLLIPRAGPPGRT